MSKATWCAGHMANLILGEPDPSDFDGYEVESSDGMVGDITFYEGKTPTALSQKVPMTDLLFNLLKRLPGSVEL